MLPKRAILLFLSLLLACQSFAPPPTPTPLITYTVDDFTFEDPLTQERMIALDRCLAEITTGSDWRHFPFTSGGNFLRAKWCRGTGAHTDCQITDSSQDQRDQHVLELYTLQYNFDLSHVFGLGMSARWVPLKNGWGAAFYFAEGGQTVVGEGFGLSLMEYNDSQELPVNQLTFGMDNSYKIGETTLSFPAQLPQRDELALYLASPDALLAHGQYVLTGLSETVKSALNAHTITTCDYGPYEANGIPPACYPRPLTAEEERVALEEAQAYFARQSEVLAENYVEMFGALGEAFPFEGCWPEK